MEFRIANAADTPAVEDLWAYCFEHKDDPFFKYYFGSYYEPEHTMVGYDKDQLVSTVHLRQYQLNVRGKAMPVSYMVGVATDPIARRGGIGGQLLQASLEELHKRGQALTILMPSKAVFYQQYGWDLYAHQWVEHVDLGALRGVTDRTLHFGRISKVEDWTLLAPVYEAYTKGLSGYAIRSEEDWKRLLGSVLAEGADIAYVKNEAGTIEGYCFYKLGEPTIAVSEMVYTSRKGQQGLLNYLYNHRSQGEAVEWNEGMQDNGYVFYPNGKSGHRTMPFMMSRIVDVVDVFQTVPSAHSQEATLTIATADSLVDANTGIFRLHFGQKGQVTVEKISDAEPNAAQLKRGIVDVYATIGSLSLLLMGRLTADELVFEGKMQATDKALAVLHEAYPKQKTYINEWW